MATYAYRKEGAPEFRPRARVVVWFLAIVFAALVSRLFYLQIIQGERYTYLSENNRVRIKKISGTRGMVVDHRGELLVDSRPSFDLIFVPDDAEDPKITLRNLARYLGRDEKEFTARLEEKQSRSNLEEIVLGRDIDWSSVVAVETHQLELPGVTLRIRPRRSYVNGGMAAHLLGYLGEIGPGQLKAFKERGYALGDEIGRFGLERKWEEYLRGRAGGQQVEVDALGRRVRLLHEVEDVPGYNVRLTLNRELQETAFEALAGKEGAIVVLDVRTGAVLAMVSAPAFDPNAFAGGITSEEWGALINDRLHPMNNRAIQGQYPPGSTFKILMAVAALEEGLVQPEARIFDPGYFVVGNRPFRDWKQEGHGWVDLHKAIVESCDVYFYQLGQRVGVDKIAEYARALGLGEKTGIPLDDEKSGLVPDRQWKRRRFREPWYPGETPSLAIGQGYLTVTPLQLANMMAAVANGGTLYRPWFVSRVESLDGTLIREYGPEVIRTVPLKQDTLDQVRAALRDVVKERSGTGGAARSDIVPIAGKTGTAQVVEMRGAYLKSEQLTYFSRDHAWFVAYAPAESPEIAVVVLVEHGGHGGSAAAPLAKKVIENYATAAERARDQREVSVPGESHAN